MTPHEVVRLAERLRANLSIEQHTRVAIFVSRDEWNQLRALITALEPITKYPKPESELPVRIQLLGIRVLVE